MNTVAKQLAEAILSDQPWPALPAEVDLDAAYELQQQVIERVAGGELAGLKAGMTAKAGQEQFGLDGPLVGSLYPRGRLEPGATVALSTGLGLECEIGVVVDAAGRGVSAGPVIEMPKLRFADSASATGPLLVAANIGSNAFLVGEQKALRDDYSDLTVTLTRNGEAVTSGTPAEALGGPLEALEWMVAEARARALPIAEGMLLITGAIGGLQPAKEGNYVADYGALGQLTFSIT